MAEAHRRPATVTRFCFVAHAAMTERLLLRAPAGEKEQPDRSSLRPAAPRWFAGAVCPGTRPGAFPKLLAIPAVGQLARGHTFESRARHPNHVVLATQIRPNVAAT
jgi:hypothetical protein